MGMLFGGWAREDEELSSEELKKKEWYRNNHVFPPAPKKAIYKGIILEVGDRVTPSLNSGAYIIRDFIEDGAIPIVDMISNSSHDCYNKPWMFDSIFVIKNVFDGK